MRILKFGVCAFAVTALGAAIPTSAVAQEDREFTFHAGSIGGTFFILGAAVTTAWQEMIDGFSANVIPGGGFGNIVQVSQGPQQLGMSTTPMLKDSRTGEGEFEKQGLTDGVQNVRALANLGYGGTYQFITLADAVPDGVNTLGDFLEAKPEIEIAVGPRGTAGEIGIRRILDLYGVTYDDIESWGGSVQFADLNDAVAGLRDGRLQAFWENAPPYHPGITELAVSRDIELLPLDSEVIKAMEEQFELPPYTIQPGVYNGVDEPVATVFEGYVLIVNEALDEDLAAEMTKIVLENKDRWVTAFRGMEAFDPANAWRTAVPLHPGAERAFREAGYLSN